jgi:hypothetical protein
MNSMDSDLINRLAISNEKVAEINSLITDPDTKVMKDFFAVVSRYGTPEEINQKAAQARQLPNLLDKVKATKPAYLKDLEWLKEQREQQAFISVSDYRQKVLGDKAGTTSFMDDFAVTLEISACQYFPWVVKAAELAIENNSLVPGRFIRVRKMKEQEADGDLPAFAAAMEIIGASFVETEYPSRWTRNDNRLLRRSWSAK